MVRRTIIIRPLSDGRFWLEVYGETGLISATMFQGWQSMIDLIARAQNGRDVTVRVTLPKKGW